MATCAFRCRDTRDNARTSLRYASVSRSLLLLNRSISRSLLTPETMPIQITGMPESRSLSPLYSSFLALYWSLSVVIHTFGMPVSVGLFCSLTGLFIGLFWHVSTLRYASVSRSLLLLYRSIFRALLTPVRTSAKPFKVEVDETYCNKK